MLKDGFRYCQTPLGKRISCQSLLVASLLLAQQDDPEPVNQCSQGEKHPVAGLGVLKGRKIERCNNTNIECSDNMSQSLALVLVHIIFSTKNRTEFVLMSDMCGIDPGQSLRPCEGESFHWMFPGVETPG
jgi:hypothetical protein